MRFLIMGLVLAAVLGGCSAKEIEERTNEIADDIGNVIRGEN